MKVQTRSRKEKAIEKAKTAVIVLLFLSCLYFGLQVFQIYRNQTVSEGFGKQNMFGTELNGKNGLDGQDILTSFEKISQPEAIVANSSQGRKILDDADQEVLHLVDSLVREMYESIDGKISSAQESDVITALNSTSLYVRYPVKRQTQFESVFYNSEKSLIPKWIREFRHLIIQPLSDGGVSVFVMGDKNSSIIRQDLKGMVADEIAKIIEEETTAEERNPVFAFEMRYNEEENAQLDPMLMITSNKKPMTAISVKIPKSYQAGISFSRPTDFSIGLIDIFGYNPNTIRQYVTDEGGLVFVGETGNLSIHPNGLIEYKALTAADGIVFGASANTAPRDILGGVFGIMEKIWKLTEVSASERGEIRITKMPEFDGLSTRYEMGLDYFVNEAKVLFNDSWGVWAVVEDGALVEFKMQVMVVDKDAGEAALSELSEFMQAENKQFDEYTTITDIKKVYMYSESGVNLKPRWMIEGER